MSKTEIFSEYNLISDKQFNEIIDRDGDDLWDQTRTMFAMNQIISPLYFSERNNYFKPKNLTLGVILSMASTYDRCLITYVVSANIFEEKRNLYNNQYVLIADIRREDIISYSKEGETLFQGVRPKIINKTISDQSVLPIGGLIPRMLFMGAVKLTSKLEKDFRERKGVSYKLSFKYHDKEIDEYIICDKEYETLFDDFLSDGWTNVKPIKPEVITQSEHKPNEGCFIATACYKNYNHPIVLELRFFRDNFLQKRSWGRRFIKFYYKHSPKYARYIATNNVLKTISKVAIIKPLYYISKFLIKQNLTPNKT
jgi:hypothetical protein